MNKQIILFTDGSINPQSKIGYGAYLAVAEIDLSHESLKKHVKIKRFEDTSSTKLELQTLLWALEDIKPGGRKSNFIYRFSKYYWITRKTRTF